MKSIAVPQQRVGDVLGRGATELGEHGAGEGLILGGVFGLGGVANQCHSLHGLSPCIQARRLRASRSQGRRRTAKDSLGNIFRRAHPFTLGKRPAGRWMRPEREEHEWPVRAGTRASESADDGDPAAPASVLRPDGGSVFDGEDIVQEALAKAAEALPSAGDIEKAGTVVVHHRAQHRARCAASAQEKG